MRMGTVIRNIPRSLPEELKYLADAGVATIHEAMGRVGLMNSYMRPIFSGAKIGGNAITVLVHPGHNLMIHVAVELCQPGDVLVVAMSAEDTHGMFGDLLATSLQARGVAGLIMDAGVRDVADLTSMRFPVWSKCISAQGTGKANVGLVNAPVTCAGALVNGGDVIVADDDGVVVVPYAKVQETIAACNARLAKEATKRARLAAGELGLDIDGTRSGLHAMGVRYYDSLEDVPEEGK